MTSIQPFGSRCIAASDALSLSLTSSGGARQRCSRCEHCQSKNAVRVLLTSAALPPAKMMIDLVSQPCGQSVEAVEPKSITGPWSCCISGLGQDKLLREPAWQFGTHRSGNSRCCSVVRPRSSIAARKRASSFSRILIYSEQNLANRAVGLRLTTGHIVNNLAQAVAKPVP